MKIPPNLPSQQVQGVKAYGNNQVSKEGSTGKPRNSDTVSVSSEAQLLSSINQVPEVRQEKINEIKKAISEGSYLTEEKLNSALDNLIQDL